MAQAPELVAAGVKVIDLAADFRMQDVAAFEVVQAAAQLHRPVEGSRLRPARTEP
jgi:N-acetyl-gamma-glutamylphosphate reductase